MWSMWAQRQSKAFVWWRPDRTREEQSFVLNLKAVHSCKMAYRCGETFRALLSSFLSLRWFSYSGTMCWICFTGFSLISRHTLTIRLWHGFVCVISRRPVSVTLSWRLDLMVALHCCGLHKFHNAYWPFNAIFLVDLWSNRRQTAVFCMLCWIVNLMQ